MIKNPTKEQMEKSLCHRCHWKDTQEKEKVLCHAVEPPTEVREAMHDSFECPFIPISYWNRIPQEQKDEYNDYVKVRSKKFYKN